MPTAHVVIAIGADHRGFSLKELLMAQENIGAINIEWIDCGTNCPERTDYPIYTECVVDAVLSRTAQLGLLLCGSGIGMSIAANRHRGIFAALVWNEILAAAAKQDENANILVLPADFIDGDQAIGIIQSWLTATFKEGRYERRLQMIDK